MGWNSINIQKRWGEIQSTFRRDGGEVQSTFRRDGVKFNQHSEEMGMKFNQYSEEMGWSLCIEELERDSVWGLWIKISTKGWYLEEWRREKGERRRVRKFPLFIDAGFVADLNFEERLGRAVPFPKLQGMGTVVGFGDFETDTGETIGFRTIEICLND